MYNKLPKMKENIIVNGIEFPNLLNVIVFQSFMNIAIVETAQSASIINKCVVSKSIILIFLSKNHNNNHYKSHKPTNNRTYNKPL